MASTDQLDLSPVAPPPSRRRRGPRSLAGGGGGVVAVRAGLSPGRRAHRHNLKTVDEVLASRAAIGSSVIRLEGVVRPHSIERTATGTDFVGTGSRGAIAVEATGSPPQLFQADIPVVVVGHFASATSSTFLGSSIMVKHTASYIAQYPNRVKAPNGSVR